MPWTLLHGFHGGSAPHGLERICMTRSKSASCKVESNNDDHQSAKNTEWEVHNFLTVHAHRDKNLFHSLIEQATQMSIKREFSIILNPSAPQDFYALLSIPLIWEDSTTPCLAWEQMNHVWLGGSADRVSRHPSEMRARSSLSLKTASIGSRICGTSCPVGPQHVTDFRTHP